MSDVGAIAVTGLGGFIGRSIVDRLVADSPGLRIVGIDHRRPFRLDERVRFHAVDLTDPTADVRLAEVLHKERVDVLLHAAFRSAPRANLDLDHELETIGSIHVMNACAAAKIHRLVVASTTMA